MTHDCPGCGKHGIGDARLSCPRCWYLLPQPLRSKIWAAWKQGDGAGSPEHRAAITEALDWYAAN